MYTVAIRKNETGEIRIQTENLKWHDSSVYWWTDGNFGCDCNRHLEFERAAGNEPDDDIECGDEKYTVLYAEMEDGERIQIDDL